MDDSLGLPGFRRPRCRRHRASANDQVRFMFSLWTQTSHPRSSSRDSAPNRSIVVMKFRDTTNVAEFVEAYNGKQFNSMEVSHLFPISLRRQHLRPMSARNMPRRSGRIDSNRRGRPRFAEYLALSINACFWSVRTSHLPSLFGTNGRCSNGASHSSLFTHIPLCLSE